MGSGGGLTGRAVAELRFLLTLWRTNLLSALEYRTAFLTQVVGMLLNNAVFMVFWVVFFQRFPDVAGWTLDDLVLLFGVVAMSFGIGVVLFGNALELSEIIAGGGLDHFLTLPRPVLPAVLASRSRISGIGDIITGIACFAIAAEPSVAAIARYALASAAGSVIFLAFLVVVQSLAFWIGGATLLQRTAINAIVTFATYPLTLFDGAAKLVLLTILPAGIIGTVSARFVRAFGWPDLAWLLVGAAIAASVAMLVFHAGLSRYESGSAIVSRAA